ncbi:hypothetical protein QBC44DRAFT_267219 [Cladorrhinum sp. PSN332]|nr:hypothetical protein QBC44DRAFT_267219 [Cladorrhinum sp. PSN332]
MVSMSTMTFLGLGVMLISLTALLVIIRIAFNVHKTHRFFLEDGLALSALFFLTAKFGLLYTSALAAADPNRTILRTLQLEVAFHFIGAAAMWSSKASILFLLIRLFGARRWLHITSLVAIFTSLALFLACVTVAAVMCTPTSGERYTNPSFLPTCLSRANTTGIIRGGVAVALDLVILTLPLPIIYKLSLPPSRKIGLFLVFLVEAFALATGIASLYFKISSGGSSMTWPSRIGTTIDCSVAIMVGCVPALYGAWCTYVSKSTSVSKVRSAISSFSNSVWRQFQKSSFSDSRNYKLDTSSHHDIIYDGSGKLPSHQRHDRILANNGVSESSGIAMTPQNRKWERLPD